MLLQALANNRAAQLGCHSSFGPWVCPAPAPLFNPQRNRSPERGGSLPKAPQPTSVCPEETKRELSTGPEPPPSLFFFF